MTNTIGVMGFFVILTTASLAMTGRDVAQDSQDDGGDQEFIAAAKRGDENAVRKALDEDSTLAQATNTCRGSVAGTGPRTGAWLPGGRRLSPAPVPTSGHGEPS